MTSGISRRSLIGQRWIAPLNVGIGKHKTPRNGTPGEVKTGADRLVVYG